MTSRRSRSLSASLGSASTNRISTLLNETRNRSQRLSDIMLEARLSSLRKALTQMVEKLMRLLDDSRSNRIIMNSLNREIHRLPVLITLALHLIDNLLEQHSMIRCKLETSCVTTTATTTSGTQLPSTSSNNNEPVWTVTTGTNTTTAAEQPQPSSTSTSTSFAAISADTGRASNTTINFG